MSDSDERGGGHAFRKVASTVRRALGDAAGVLAAHVRPEGPLVPDIDPGGGAAIADASVDAERLGDLSDAGWNRVRPGPLIAYDGEAIGADLWVAAPPEGARQGRRPDLEVSEFGELGPASRCPVWWACLEMALRSAGEFAVLPDRNGRIGGPKCRRLVSDIDGARRALTVSDAAAGWTVAAWATREAFNYPSPVDVDLSSLDAPDTLAPALDRWTEVWSDYLRQARMGRVASSGPPGDPADCRRAIGVETVASEADVGCNRLRVCVDGRGGSARMLADGPAKADLAAAREGLGTVRAADGTEVHLLDRELSAREVADAGSVDSAVERLEAWGFDVEVDDAVGSWADRLARRRCREAVPFEQMVEADGGWTERHADDGVRSELSDLYEQYRREIEDAVPWNLWAFQQDDLARLLCKPAAIYALPMGGGKARQIASYMTVRGGRRNLLVLESRLVGEYLRECDKIGLDRSRIHVIEDPPDARPENLGWLNIISYSRLWRPVTDTRRAGERPVTVVRHEDRSTGETVELEAPGHDLSRSELPEPPGDGWRMVGLEETTKRVDGEGAPSATYAHRLRRTRFNTVAFDEAHRLKGGRDTKQGRHAMLLRGKHVLAASGTIVTSYPRDIYAVLVAVFGERTTASKWGWREPIEHPDREGEWTTPRKVFRDRYRKFESEDGRSREVPEVPDDHLDDWRDMLAPKVLRRRRDEPAMRAAIETPEPDLETIEFEPDREHARFYKWWLESFREWYEAEVADGEAGMAAILAQLQKLQFAATLPQHESLDVAGAPKWSGGKTSKQQGVLEDVVDRVRSDRRVIVFSERPDLVERFAGWCRERGVSAAVFHGDALMDERDRRLERFKAGGFDVLAMSRTCGCQGYNIAEADVVWQIDWPWTPSKLDQSQKRMLRPDWPEHGDRAASERKPIVRRAVQKGTIDEYQRRLVERKADGIGEALDWQEAGDHDHVDYREVSERMLREYDV